MNDPALLSTHTGLARIAEAAEFLNLSRPSVYRHIANGDIPVRRFGKTVRIPWAWLNSQNSIDAD
ncbi:MAG: helix-turn-helix domain-containing protein [Fuerstiella sp.]